MSIDAGSPTDPNGLRDLLSLSQWLSPAFPIGGFAYSHGLDWVVAAGDLGGEPEMRHWLSDTLEFGAGRSDSILLSLAHRAVYPPEELADMAAALSLGKERWKETIAQGTAFVATTNAILGTDLPPLPLPVAVGTQARRLRLPTSTVAGLYLQGFAGNLTAISTRIVPLGQTAGQRILSTMAPLITRLAHAAKDAEVDDLATSVFRSDLASMQHETQDVRLFRS